ncbi:MAG: Rossmann-like and DUF2520 domain-containing protein [FCB group bacterium]|jgi:predicted short-subunit dehydrogenase-like oxidoreductase (DUF2520 family)
MQNYNIGIIGAGKLGLSLAMALESINSLNCMVIKPEQNLPALTRYFEKKISIYTSLSELQSIPQILFLTVNDSSIESVASQLANQFGKMLKDKIIVHCSGFLGLDVLAQCKAEGAVKVSAHPYQTFFEPAKELFKGISWGIESEGSVEIISDIIRQIGGNPVKLNFSKKEDKAMYHASAVAVSNSMTASIDMAKDIFEKLGVDAEQFILPILKTTLENNFSQSEKKFDFPLTGPFARGDIETIKLHIKALEHDNYLLKSYCYLGLGTLEASIHHKLIDVSKYKEISDILTEILVEKKIFISYH